MLTRFYTVLLGQGNTVYSSTGTENAVYSSTGMEIVYTLTIRVLLGPTLKTGYPLSTTHTVKRYLFETDYVFDYNIGVYI